MRRRRPLRDEIANTLIYPEAAGSPGEVSTLIDCGGEPAIYTAKLLRNYRATEYTSILLTHLTHPEAAVREEIVKTLETLIPATNGNKQAMVDSLLIVLNDPEEKVRQQLYRRLNQLDLTDEQQASVDRARKPATPSP